MKFKACHAVPMALVGLLTLAPCYAGAAYENVTEVTSPVVEQSNLTVEYSEGELPAQQAALEVLAARENAPASRGGVRCFDVLPNEPVYKTLRQGVIRRMECPVRHHGSLRFDATTSLVPLDGGRVSVPAGFLMDMEFERGTGAISLSFHAQSQRSSSIPGTNSARMQAFHSAARVTVHPNNCVVVTGVDGNQGFLLLTFRSSTKF